MNSASKSKSKVSARRGSKPDKTAVAVLDSIECITTVPRDSLKVTVHEGWVRLEGTVQDWSEKETVDNIVRHVPGVKGLISLLEVIS